MQSLLVNAPASLLASNQYFVTVEGITGAVDHSSMIFSLLINKRSGGRLCVPVTSPTRDFCCPTDISVIYDMDW